MPTHYKGSPEEELALDTYIKLTRSINALDARLSSHGELGDLTISQFGVLETLYHLGDLAQHEIGAKLLKSGGNMTLVIDNLEKHGLVQRERCKEDRRVIYVKLTEAGRSLIADIFPKQARAIVAEMSALNADEQVLLGKLCRKLGKPQSDPQL